MPLFAQVLQYACLLNFALELLERPVEPVRFIENDFNHFVLSDEEIAMVRKSRADGSARLLTLWAVIVET